MKKFLTYVFATASALSFLITPITSHAECDIYNFIETFCPYGGIEGKWQNILGRGDWKYVFTGSHGGGSFFIGSRFSDFMGVELGYTQLFEGTKTRSFGPGDSFFSRMSTNGAQIKASCRYSSVYLDLNGYYPCFDGCFDFIGSLGISSMQPRIRIRVTNLGPAGTGGASGFTADDAARLERIRAQANTIFRLGAGLQYMFCNCIGVRGLVRFENTSALRFLVPAPFTAPIIIDQLRRPFRDSISLAVGVFASF